MAEYIQMSIFDYLKSLNEPEVLLEEGQKVYMVSRAEIYEYNTENSYLVDTTPEERYYTLKKGSGYSTACNSQLGKSLFLQKEDAEEAVKNYKGRIWRSSSIAFKEAGFWECVRESDGHLMKAWYGIVPGPLGADSGLVVFKNPMSFIHAIDFGTEKAARKYIENTFAAECNKYGLVKKDNCAGIEYCNLYPCKEGNSWTYAADGYTGLAA